VPVYERAVDGDFLPACGAAATSPQRPSGALLALVAAGALRRARAAQRACCCCARACALRAYARCRLYAPLAAWAFYSCLKVVLDVLSTHYPPDACSRSISQFSRIKQREHALYLFRSAAADGKLRRAARNGIKHRAGAMFAARTRVAAGACSATALALITAMAATVSRRRRRRKAKAGETLRLENLRSIGGCCCGAGDWTAAPRWRWCGIWTAKQRARLAKAREGGVVCNISFCAYSLRFLLYLFSSYSTLGGGGRGGRWQAAAARAGGGYCFLSASLRVSLSVW